ncbi:capsular exopolysaccharide family [Blastococcus sp. DSM 46786]|uniref:polysaccharide biosynthesis tyrosine autokinase n=1 Tax=Blastococcus sp. DSM 46786 TaxID=1798227 RepID=UPI0008BC1A09|nr:polysaccharide biosynthesis tyrosine autokinase [Blastococcus sp. DSM 46786]SEL20356.1 capsular exopolysaccharide family [Blastococcus sp. DSM 46786]
MSLSVFLGLIRRRSSWLVAGVVLAVAVAGVGSLTATRLYTAEARLFFTLEYGDSAGDLAQGSNYLQSQVASFALLAETPTVLGPAGEAPDVAAGSRSLAAQVSASVVPETVVVQISATDPSPARAAAIANAVAAELELAVEGLSPAGEDGSPAVRATTVAPAGVPGAPVSPRTSLNLAVGVLAGLLLGCGLALARDRLDTRVRDAAVVAQLTGLPVVGSIPTRPSGSTAHPAVDADPHGVVAEAVRQFRTNLQFLGMQDEERAGARIVAVTSSRSGEGKSTVAVELAAALAETGTRVLLVDADLRRPTIADRLGLEAAAGLTTALLGRASVADLVQEWGTAGLHVLPSGPVPPNPSGLLGSPVMRRLLERLRDDYDHVVLDTAPVLPVSDAAVLSRSVDGLVVLADVTRVRRAQLSQSLHSLAQVQATVLGVVLNQVRREAEVYGYAADVVAGTDRPVPTAPAPLPAARSAEAADRPASRR